VRADAKRGAGIRRAGCALAALVVLGAVPGCAELRAGVGPTKPTPPAETVVVPLQILRQGPSTIVLVPVYIQGRGPYRFLLDTGASVSVVDDALADQLALEPTGTRSAVQGAMTRGVAQMVRVNHWRLGESLELGSDELAVLDVGEQPVRLDGLLGSDQLRGFGTVVIDYTNRQLRLGG